MAGKNRRVPFAANGWITTFFEKRGKTDDFGGVAGYVMRSTECIENLCVHLPVGKSTKTYIIDFGRSAMRMFTWLGAFAFAAAALFAGNSWAGTFGPFTADADTLHLWHMNDGSGPVADDPSVASPLNLTLVDQATANPGVGSNTTLGNAGFTGFGTSAGFAGNATIPTNAPTVVPHRPILLGATALNNADGDTVPFTFANSTTGAFTWEAMIKFDSSFDPTSTTYRNATAATGGNYPMEIISGEGDANAHRNWQFRYDQIGAGTSSGANGVTKPRIEFANLHGISGNQSIALDLPTTGPDAVNNTDWFHVAVEYNGSPNTAGNLIFFWTDVTNDPNAAAPHFLGSTTMTNSLLSAAANSPDFAIGDEARDAGSGAGEGESFVGLIDEVRMSDNVRYVPEPSSMVLAGLGVMGLVGLLRRKM
jgi:hypothetical protein